MSNAAKSHIVKIGNSKAIRIPKRILEQLGWGEEVEMSVCGDQLVMWSTTRPRSGWEEQFKRMAECGDDRPLDTE
jgi:antitoxin MazE